MHITVAGKQVETGEALQTHVREGLGAIAQKYFDHALEANVTFRRDVKGKGGAIDSNSITAMNGLLLVNSGYAMFGQTGGNMLLAFKPKG
jgi:ribosome-associated translation inhibitor RaiA